MKNVFIILVISISLLSCDHPSKEESDLPMICNVKFSPATVKRGDIITITYNLYKRDDWSSEWINAHSVDPNGNVAYREWIEINPRYVEFALYVNVKGAEKYSGEQEGYHYIDYEGYFHSDIYATKYTSFKWGEIKCYVPCRAKSGTIKINFEGYGVGYGGFSEENLIVVDESGDEIW